eukprot:g3749.t1
MITVKNTLLRNSFSSMHKENQNHVRPEYTANHHSAPKLYLRNSPNPCGVDYLIDEDQDDTIANDSADYRKNDAEFTTEERESFRITPCPPNSYCVGGLLNKCCPGYKLYEGLDDDSYCDIDLELYKLFWSMKKHAALHILPMHIFFSSLGKVAAPNSLSLHSTKLILKWITDNVSPQILGFLLGFTKPIADVSFLLQYLDLRCVDSTLHMNCVLHPVLDIHSVLSLLENRYESDVKDRHTLKLASKLVEKSWVERQRTTDAIERDYETGQDLYSVISDTGMQPMNDFELRLVQSLHCDKVTNSLAISDSNTGDYNNLYIFFPFQICLLFHFLDAGLRMEHWFSQHKVVVACGFALLLLALIMERVRRQRRQLRKDVDGLMESLRSLLRAHGPKPLSVIKEELRDEKRDIKYFENMLWPNILKNIRRDQKLREFPRFYQGLQCTHIKHE